MTFSVAYSEDAFLESYWESRTECDYDEYDAAGGYWGDEDEDDEDDEYGDSDYGPGGDSCSNFIDA